MPFESVIMSVAVIAMFAVFMGALWWAWNRSH